MAHCFPSPPAVQDRDTSHLLTISIEKTFALPGPIRENATTHSVSHGAAVRGNIITPAGKSSTGDENPRNKRANGAVSVTSGKFACCSGGIVIWLNAMDC